MDLFSFHCNVVAYEYQYDEAGNRTQEQVTIGMTITTTNWTFDAANRVNTMQIGSNPVVNFSYDANGNLRDDGQNTYTWDRANRMTALNTGSVTHNYKYDGNGNRHQQSIGATVTNYLLDLQPGLALVLRETTGSDQLHYLHSPRGVHAVQERTAGSGGAVWGTSVWGNSGSTWPRSKSRF